MRSRTMFLRGQVAVLAMIALLVTAPTAALVAPTGPALRQETGGAPATPEPEAAVEVRLRKANGREYGAATFAAMADGSVAITVSVHGLTPGEHGIHVHETGVCDPAGSPQFGSAGRHYNPDGAKHGDPTTVDVRATPAANDLASPSAHAGDLGNIRADEAGRAELHITTNAFTLAELGDADGSALVIHRDRDDLATNPEGRSGARIICGVIFDPTSESESTSLPTEVAGATPEAAAGSVLFDSAAPNVVMIIADDLDAGTFETALPYLPHLGALRTQAVDFSNFIITTPLCCPSRVSILRGQYAHNHGVLDNLEPEGGFPAFHESGREDSTLATWLDKAGYQTALIGKYLNRYPIGADFKYVPPGWDEWVVPLARPGTKDAHLKFGYGLDVNGTLIKYGDAPEDYVTDVLAEHAVNFVRRAAPQDAPFFLYLAPTSPHGPFDPAPRHAGAFTDTSVPRGPSFNEADVADKPDWVRSWQTKGAEEVALIDETYRLRLEMLLSVDEMVGGVLDALRETGSIENTYIIFVSDNGFHLGEHRLWAKRSPYEESIRVPLLVSGPGVRNGATVDELALNIDLAPTIAEWASVQSPEFVDGRSLAPLLYGEEIPTWRQAGLIEIFPLGELPAPASTAASDVTESGNSESGQLDAPLIRTYLEAPVLRGLRTEDLLYVEYETGERELYDLRLDPAQQDNLAETADPIELERLATWLDTLAGCSGIQCQIVEDTPLVP